MRVLVTGASQGIGRATALRMAGPGREVAVHYHRHEKEAEEVVAEIERRHGSAFAISGDMGVLHDVREMARALAERWPVVDVMIHNAGEYPRKRFLEVDWSEFERCMRVNVIGASELTRLLLPRLVKSKSGRLIFITSVLAATGSRHGAHYAASKAAMEGMARSLARELAPGTTVNVVAPGSVDTAILAGDTPGKRAERVGSIPMSRLGTPEDVAEAIAFLASPSGSYITGATLHVNGGLLMG